jgi:glycosyltransferase involved in cell wall biosynthesis
MPAQCVVTSFNTVEVLKLSLPRLLADGIRVVVVDNGSDDGTREYLQMLAKVIVVCNSTNLGSSVARNQGISKCNGNRSVLLLDGDILYIPGSYRMLSAIMQKARVDCVGLDPDCCTAEASAISEIVLPSAELVDGWIAYTQYGLFSRKVFNSCRFDEQYGIGWGYEDDDLFLQMVEHGFRVKQLQWKYYHLRRSSVHNLSKRGSDARLGERKEYFFRKWDSRRYLAPHLFETES